MNNKQPSGATVLAVKDSHCSSSWWDHPALIWEEFCSDCNNESGNNGGSAAYWSVLPVSAVGDEHQPEGATTTTRSLSYEKFFFYTIELARQIIGAAADEENVMIGATTKKKSLVVSVPVAVAIPEGPLLPLALAAVHALNVPFLLQEQESNNNQQQTEFSIVLLPLDPSDGRARLTHMLREARPSVILTAADCDTQRLQEVIAAMDADDDGLATNDDNEVNDPLYRSSNSMQVLNVSDLLLSEASSSHGDQQYTSKRHRSNNSPLPRATVLSRDNETSSASLQQQLNEYARQSTGVSVLGDSKTTSPESNRISHLVYTSGTTGRPKGCLCSSRALQHYLTAKNRTHGISSSSVVLLASALTFDPCLSDALATLTAHATLALAPRRALLQNLTHTLRSLRVSHVLCTPTLWGGTSFGSSNSSSNPKDDLVDLKVVALGGERIPPSIVGAWARPKSANGNNNIHNKTSSVRLCATFGVTEACVYQTYGEVFGQDGDRDTTTTTTTTTAATPPVGQDVGLPFDGMSVRICREAIQDRLVDVTEIGAVGEVILAGNQLDAISSYLRRPNLTATKFVQENEVSYYRTGDRGFLHPTTSRLHIMGRIVGEDGMVKFNGVRVELSEVEMALVDESSTGGNPSVILDAIVVPVRLDDNTSAATNLYAYVVLGRKCLLEIGLSSDVRQSGWLCTDGPLLVLLRARCRQKARATPSAFVVLPRVPLSPTGKRNRKGVPPIESASPMVAISLSDSDANGARSVPLFQYGRTGPFVAKEIRSCLNLTPSQEKLLTTAATFGKLGGDSLGATRVVRAIFAAHKGENDNRHLGGEFGTFGGPFDVVHLLSAKSLGDYVDWLDSQGVCESMAQASVSMKDEAASPVNETPTKSPASKKEENEASELYDAMLQAVTAGLANIAIALLDIGADPNHGDHGGRLGKTSGRKDRKKIFRTSPLHLACLQGNPKLVCKLLEKKAKYNTPDASGLFPIHLAAAGEFNKSSTEEEDGRRLLCLQSLLEAGAPLSMKDGSRQSILHAAARAGHCRTLRYAMEQWISRVCSIPNKKGSLDWRDNWARTPVHWAVLNGKADALAILLEMGCNANPYKPKESQKRSSIAVESPLEICERLHGESSIGKQMKELLMQHSDKLRSDDL